MGQAGIARIQERVVMSIFRVVWYVMWGGCLLAMFPIVLVAAEKVEVEYAKGIVKYSNRDYLDALDHFRKVVELEPENADGQFYLGLSLTRIGEFQDAIVALEKVLQLDASKQYVHYHLGLAYFQDKRYKDALAQFRLAETFDPKKAATQFYLGYTHYLLKQYRKVPPYLHQALELDPTLALSAHYYRGLSLFSLERDDQAKAAFEAAATVDPESIIGRNAQRYLEAIKARASQYRLLQVQAVTSYQWDDNVILEPSEIAISDEADGRMVFALVGRLLPIHNSVWRFGAEYSLFQSVHFRLHDFDIQSHTGGLFARLKLNRVTFHGVANYNFTLLDNDRFSEAFTLQPSATIQQTEALFAIVSARYRRSNYFGEDFSGLDPAVRERDGWTVRAGVHQYLIFNKKRSFVRLGYHYEASRNDGTDWEYNSHEIGLGLQTPLLAGIVLNVDWGYTRKDYRHINSFDAGTLAVLDAGVDTQERLDDRLTGAITLTRPLGRYFILSVGSVHTRNISNIAFFDYARNIITVALTGRY